MNAPHEINIHTAFGFAEQLGIAMPPTVEIFAVEAEDVRTLTEEMTERVAAAVEPLARELHTLLKERVKQSGAVKSGKEPEDPEPPARPYYSPWES